MRLDGGLRARLEEEAKKTDRSVSYVAAKAIEASGGGIIKGPYDDAHERRAVVYDNKGNGLVFYSPLSR